MSSPDLIAIFNFINELDKLKHVLRVNRLQDGSRRENTAEHSWHIATMVLVLAPYAQMPLDMVHTVKMALIHDIVEIDAGDTYAFDREAHADKWERELRSARRIFGLLPPPLADEFLNLWIEYEELTTASAQFVAALDRLAPFLQHMGNEGVTWREKGMTRSLLMTRAGDIQTYLPKVWPLVAKLLDEAIAKGWLQDR